MRQHGIFHITDCFWHNDDYLYLAPMYRSVLLTASSIVRYYALFINQLHYTHRLCITKLDTLKRVIIVMKIRYCVA